MTAPLLMVPKAEARTKIANRLDVGRSELLNFPIQSEDQFREVSRATSRWRKFNVDLLKSLFSDDSLAAEFDEPIHFIYSGAPQPITQQIQSLHKDIEIYLNRLQSILERVEIFHEAPAATQRDQPSVIEQNGEEIFIVHGHAGREGDVARVVEQMGRRAVILGERPHQGATLIEKLERESKKCGYAIVIYTGDDLGKSNDPDSDEDYALRARENVVLELGYFVGLLGRARVTVLHGESVEFPTDFRGVAYYPLDKHGAWKERLKEEVEIWLRA